MDERFDEPAGGFVALDTYERALGLPGVERILLLGEGTFHQPHGGTSTDLPESRLGPMLETWHARYRELRGRELEVGAHDFVYLGSMPEPWRAQLAAWAILGSLKRTPETIAALWDRFGFDAGRDDPHPTVWDAIHGVRDALVAANAETEKAREETLVARVEAAELRRTLDRTRATRSWRWLAPLRRIAGARRG